MNIAIVNHLRSAVQTPTGQDCGKIHQNNLTTCFMVSGLSIKRALASRSHCVASGRSFLHASSDGSTISDKWW